MDTAKLIDLVLAVTPRSKEKLLKQRANNQGFLALTGFHSSGFNSSVLKPHVTFTKSLY